MPFNRIVATTMCTTICIASLAGCASVTTPVSVADTIAATPQLSTLNSLLNKAGLSEILKDGGPFTVYAPSNEAFGKVPVKTMEALASDPVRLKAVLAYHVIPARVVAADVKNGNVKTVNGANVAMAKAGDFVTVEDAIVQRADITATNGLVDIIDSVLMPPAAR